MSKSTNVRLSPPIFIIKIIYNLKLTSYKMNITSEKNRPLKSFEGFLYRLDRILSNGNESWRCPRKTCKGRIHIENNTINIVTEHNHVVNVGEVEAKETITIIKERAANSRDPPRFLIHQAQATITNEGLAEMPKYTSIQRTIERKRKRDGNNVINPRNVAEIHVPNELRETLRGDNFLLFDSGEDDVDRFFIFGTERNLDLLETKTNWFADGTFKVAPNLFYQLYTIHILHENTVIPMLYIFLQRKREIDYVNVLNKIKELRPNIQPSSIMCDFEKGFHNAIQQVFGAETSVVGCLFHLGQCIYRKVVDVGLRESYVNDEETRLFCKMLTSLAFIPEADVIAAYEALMDSMPAENLEPLTDYFEDTWIGRPQRRGRQRRNPSYPISVWSIYDRVIDGLPRTNNSVEGWHNAFQRTVGFNHPSVYKLIEAIQYEQSNSENLVQQIDTGRLITKKNYRYERIDQALKTIVNSYPRREHLDYLRAISYNLTINV